MLSKFHVAKKKNFLTIVRTNQLWWNSHVKIKQRPLAFGSHVSTLMYSLLALPTKLLPDIDHRNLTLICTEISRQHHRGSQLENDRLLFTVIDPELPCNV